MPARRSGRALGAKLFEHIGDGRLLRRLVREPRRVCLLLRLDPPQLVFQLAAANFEPAGDLGQQLIAILDAGSDIAGAVLKFALALKIESVEQDLGNGFRVFLRDEPLGKLVGDSLIRQQFLQINSNMEPAFGREAERCSRNRDRCCVFFSMFVLLWAYLEACEAEDLGRTGLRFWTTSRHPSKDFGPLGGVSSKEIRPVCVAALGCLGGSGSSVGGRWVPGG